MDAALFVAKKILELEELLKYGNQFKSIDKSLEWKIREFVSRIFRTFTRTNIGFVPNFFKIDLSNRGI